MTQDKDAPLREDIRLLGRLLGDTVRDQQGEAVFELIEHIRQNSVRFRRDDDVAARRELEDVLDALSREQTLQVVRAFSLTGHPKMLRTGKGPLLPVYEGLPQLSPLNALGKSPGLPVCGSVSTLAFSLAQRLGCSPIVFVVMLFVFAYQQDKIDREHGVAEDD